MNQKSAQVATICQCLDHCFAFLMWCEDFARYVESEDMVMGLDRAHEIVSDATRLHSFLALRKIDEFLGVKKAKPDDLIASDIGIDASAILGGPGSTFLSVDERESINKGAAHLTERLTLEADTEVDLHVMLARSIPRFELLAAALRKADTQKDAVQWLDKTDSLIARARQILNRTEQEKIDAFKAT